MNLRIILGNQLFPHYYYQNDDHIFMCESYDLCTHYKYHKHKIIFFLSSMRHYAEELRALKDKHVYYCKLQEKKEFFEQLKTFLSKSKYQKIKIYEIEDKFFEAHMHSFCHEEGIELEVNKSPMFLVSRGEFQEYLKSTKKPFMKTFYEGLRKTTGILMDNGSPVGGKFSFDSENRKKIPKKLEVEKREIFFKHDKITKEVIELVDKEFHEHPGDSKEFWLAVNRHDALKHLHDFFKNFFEDFGTYEDALDDRDPFLFHSVLSPYLNIGFFTPEEIIKKSLKENISLNSKEGFVRQVIGWREFVHGIYQNYSERQDEENFFKHDKKLTIDWYKGTTGILPLDDAIKKTNKFGYAHHIERLMVLSNIMLLCEVDPREVHRWFMEMYVDSSDWVMGPNVYGMAQFSDGGIFATKPYIASSNYIRKMSHYKKDGWCEIMDGLYWRFIEKHRDFLKKNYRMKMMVSMLDKMENSRKKELFQLADDFIQKVTY